MKTRNKKYDIKEENIKINKLIFKNNKLLLGTTKNNESLELINKEKNKSVEYDRFRTSSIIKIQDALDTETYVNHLVNLSKLVQMNIISKYRYELKEIPSSQFILDIIINLPMKDCKPQDNKFIDLIYAIFRAELNNGYYK